MKVILDIDNDWVVAFATLTGLKENHIQKIKDYLAEKDYIEVGVNDLGEDFVQQMKMLGVSLVLAKIGQHENN